MKQIETIKLILFVTALNSFVPCNSYAQIKTITVWSSIIPDEIKNNEYLENEIYSEGVLEKVSQVSIPTLSVFPASEPDTNKTAVMVIPGGGYSHLSINNEGATIAKWLNSLGITALVLKYRLPSAQIMKDKTIGPLHDAQEAIRNIRRNAKKWDINPTKIGIIGFSAGGHLGATLSTHYSDNTYPVTDTISARPNFAMLIYPVISMKNEITHKGSQNNLLGTLPSPNLIEKFSNEKLVTASTPPTFIIHAADDKAVPSENSIEYYLALKKHHVPAELHIYEKGGHGFGIKPKDIDLNWTTDCENWLKNHKFLL